jgi:2-dehydropantoate 2-reductase
MMPIDKPVGVLGAGPVGTILAAALAKTGQQVVLIEAADTRRQQLEKDGLRVSGKQQLSSRDVTLLASIEQLKDHPLSALFLCTKTWSLGSFLPSLAQSLNPDCLVISYQNGIGPEDEVALHFDTHRVARGVVNYAGGVSKDSGEATMVWFNPPNFLGPLSHDEIPLLGELAAILNRVELTTKVIEGTEVKKLAFFKTILNAALSALCAVSNTTMRQAMTYPHTRRMAADLLREGLLVAAEQGFHYGDSALEDCMGYLDKGGDHYPSMWYDLQAKSRTEIEAINGKLASLGLMTSGLDVSSNRFLTSLIVTHEINAGVRTPDEVPEYLVQEG